MVLLVTLYFEDYHKEKLEVQLVFHLGLQVEAEFIDYIRWVHYILRDIEFTFRGLPQVLASLLQKLGVVLPFLNHFREYAERGDTRWHVVLVAAFGHKREQARHNGHCGLKGHHIAVVTYARTGVLVWVVAYIFAELVAQDAQKSSLRAREEGLADAAALIEEMVVGYLFLVFIPKSFLHKSLIVRFDYILGDYLGNVFHWHIVGVLECFLAHRASRGDGVGLRCQQVVACGVAYGCLLLKVE